MSSYRVTVLPGDGTGKEVMLESMKILDIFHPHFELLIKLGKISIEIASGIDFYIIYMPSIINK